MSDTKGGPFIMTGSFHTEVMWDGTGLVEIRVTIEGRGYIVELSRDTPPELDLKGPDGREVNEHHIKKILENVKILLKDQSRMKHQQIAVLKEVCSKLEDRLTSSTNT